MAGVLFAVGGVGVAAVGTEQPARKSRINAAARRRNMAHSMAQEPIFGNLAMGRLRADARISQLLLPQGTIQLL
jgi:hypothetical protein